MRSILVWQAYLRAALATNDVSLAEAALRRIKEYYHHALIGQEKMIASWFQARGRADIVTGMCITAEA